MTDFAAKRGAMVEGQVRTNDVRDTRLTGAMRTLPRERFLPESQSAVAYAELHIELAPGRVLLRPRDFSKLVQALEIAPGERVLDLGCGAGYSAAVLSQLGAAVVAVEEDSALAGQAKTLLAEMAPGVMLVEGPLASGAPGHAPFDAILVNGAVESPPREWLDQLADGGRLGVFERVRGAGRAALYRRNNGAVGRRDLFDADVPFLPDFAPRPAFVF